MLPVYRHLIIYDLNRAGRYNSNFESLSKKIDNEKSNVEKCTNHVDIKIKSGHDTL